MAVSLLRRPGLDLAEDPILPAPPDPQPAPQPAAPQAVAIGRALAPMLRDAQAATLSAVRLTDAHGVVIATTGNDLGLSLAGWEEVAGVLAGAPVRTSMRSREPVAAPFGSISRASRLRVFVVLPVESGTGVEEAVVLSRTPRGVGQALTGDPTSASIHTRWVPSRKMMPGHRAVQALRSFSAVAITRRVVELAESICGRPAALIIRG
jgi:hypothetical protein